MARAPRVTLTSWVVGRLARLGPVRVGPAIVERDLSATMPDGAVLLADRWYPAVADGAGSGLPLVLARCPYGRRQVGLVGRLLAERGYQVVIQSCRGTFGSDGPWDPFRNERADGHATLEWLLAQPWCGNTIVTFGPSYLGLTQWAVVDDPPEQLRAVALDVTAANFRDGVVYPGDSFALETGAAWVFQVEHQERGFWQFQLAQRRSRGALARAYSTLPLRDADRVALGHPVPAFQDWLVHEQPGDPWWAPVDFSSPLDRVPPATMVGGWYDIFLPRQVADFDALRRAGREARLTIGPWTHASMRGLGFGLRDALDWFDRQLGSTDAARGAQAPVRLYVMGSRRWVEFDEWPPPATVQRWHLHAAGRLDRSPPDGSRPDRYRYDPENPTPGVGGPTLDVRNAGPKDQQAREERDDVLSYTSDVLRSDVSVIGPVRAEVWFRSDAAHTDVFVRLCDVSPKGRSRNVCDGILRLSPDSQPPDQIRKVVVAMWPTAMTFRSGHRIRLQVSSAAHPVFARNTNSGEPLATAATVKVAQQEVFHDPEHPSAIELPVTYL